MLYDEAVTHHELCNEWSGHNEPAAIHHHRSECGLDHVNVTIAHVVPSSRLKGPLLRRGTVLSSPHKKQQTVFWFITVWWETPFSDGLSSIGFKLYNRFEIQFGILKPRNLPLKKRIT